MVLKTVLKQELLFKQNTKNEPAFAGERDKAYSPLCRVEETDTELTPSSALEV